MTEYAALCHVVEKYEAMKAQALEKILDAYEWPDDLPIPTDRDRLGVDIIDGHVFAEDLTSELAIANRSSEPVAGQLVENEITLSELMPLCWRQVKQAAAPMWQACQVAEACFGLDEQQHATVDQRVAPALGGLVYSRLMAKTRATVARVDPDGLRLAARRRSDRYVRVGVDKDNPAIGWLHARLNRPDQILLHQTIDRLADRLSDGEHPATRDEARASALGMLANPAAAQKLLDDGTLPAPAGIRAHVYIHAFAQDLADPDGVTRVEHYGPALIDQVKTLTRAGSVRLTPVVHADATTIVTDAYEIPDRLREQVIATNPYTVAPYSAVEARLCDLDHIAPYQPGIPGQTRTDNLAPLARRPHRLKTHCDWTYRQPTPGTYLWTTHTGQHVTVDQNGTHPSRE
jgi:hypothetical protein